MQNCDLSGILFFSVVWSRSCFVVDPFNSLKRCLLSSFFFILMVNWIGHTTLWQILSDIHWLIDRQTDRHSSQNQLYLFVKLHFNCIDAKVCSDVVFSVLLISVICVIYLSNRFLLLKHWCFFYVKYYPNFHRLQINWNSLWFIVICKLLKQQQMFNNICPI